MMGSPLIEINPKLLSNAEAFFKRGIDLTASICALILLAPVFLTLAIIIRLDQKDDFLPSGTHREMGQALQNH